MLAWLRENGVPHTVVATKLDKVKPSRLATRRRDLASGCGLDTGDVFWVSAAKGTGIDDLRRHVVAVLS
jgi:GTP-binding protein